MANLLPITDGKTTWRLLAKSILKTPWQLALLVLLFVASSVATLITPIMVGQLIDRATTGQLTGYPWAELVVIGAAVVAGALLARAWTFQGQKMGVRLNRDLGIDLVGASLYLDAQTVEDAGSGDLVARLTDDVDSVRQVLATGLPEFAHISIYMVITAATIFTVNPAIGLVTVPMFIVMTMMLRIFLPRIAQLTREKTEAISDLTVVATENIRGAATVSELGIGQARARVQEERIWRSFEISDRMVVVRSVFWAVDAFNSFLPLVLSMVWGAYCVEQGWATWGDVATASIMLFTMRVNSDIFTFWLDRLREMTVTMGRVFGVIDLSHQQQARRAAGQKAAPVDRPVRGASAPVIDLVGVTYGYDPDAPVIKGVDLQLAAGESLALVGRSGSGKTTLARLIAGSLTADSGTVQVEDHLVGNGLYPTQPDASGRPALLICTQEAHVFVGTLAENMRVAAPDASDGQVLAALRSVGATWVDDLPEGLESQVGGGSTELTRDQIQQLGLARIVVANPHAVILDESTTQLELADARQSLAAVMQGRAVIIISHDARIASLADRAVLLEDGELVAEGKPEHIFARA
ncbi:MAG: ABC transporter ATP-binding protein [Rothia sp. (in: high G+C Gram-positive bacteria)]|uniref:ABC transporter ATP-binding protein n=1 Tax=Rothia sp. (in: high G+C Gram-positive bacteria) TaxID=1885016 RepID=UPI002704B692|nr:ABC transporter ATP-binding protein [Rothia sp. (in: high G+C Gram-positive bacteria)]